MRLRPKAQRPAAPSGAAAPPAAAPNPAAVPQAAARAPSAPRPGQAPPPDPASLQNPYRRFFTKTPRFEDLARRARAGQTATPRPAGEERPGNSEN